MIALFCVPPRRAAFVLAAVAATGVCAALAATPPLGPQVAAAPRIVEATLGDSATALRPFGDGPAILIGRAYGPDDEDCSFAVTRGETADGGVTVTRDFSCPQ